MKTIKISEEFEIPETGIILEAGDEISVVSSEEYPKEGRPAFEEFMDMAKFMTTNRGKVTIAIFNKDGDRLAIMRNLRILRRSTSLEFSDFVHDLCDSEINYNDIVVEKTKIVIDDVDGKPWTYLTLKSGVEFHIAFLDTEL